MSGASGYDVVGIVSGSCVFDQLFQLQEKVSGVPGAFVVIWIVMVFVLMPNFIC